MPSTETLRPRTQGPLEAFSEQGSSLMGAQNSRPNPSRDKEGHLAISTERAVTNHHHVYKATATGDTETDTCPSQRRDGEAEEAQARGQNTAVAGTGLTDARPALPRRRGHAPSAHGSVAKEAPGRPTQCECHKHCAHAELKVVK